MAYFNFLKLFLFGSIFLFSRDIFAIDSNLSFRFQPGDSYSIQHIQTRDSVRYSKSGELLEKVLIMTAEKHFLEVIDVDQEGNIHVIFTIGTLDDQFELEAPKEILSKMSDIYTISYLLGRTYDKNRLQGKVGEIIITSKGEIKQYNNIDNFFLNYIQSLFKELSLALPEKNIGLDSKWQIKDKLGIFVPFYPEWFFIWTNQYYQLSNIENNKGIISISGNEWCAPVFSPAQGNLTNFKGIVCGNLHFDMNTGIPNYFFIAKDRSGTKVQDGDNFDLETLTITITKL